MLAFSTKILIRMLRFVSTQRDLIAGEVSKDIARRKLIPTDILEAHDSGAIHFHDMDYIIQPMFNCCLINLEDMLTNWYGYQW